MTDCDYQVHAINAFHDNYIWAIERTADQEVVVIDPGDAVALETWLTLQNKSLAAILITHKHPDHIGGLPHLLNRHRLPVFGNPDTCAYINNPVFGGDQIELLGIGFKVLDLKAHTLDHIGYFAGTSKQIPQPWLFCGDTLFSGGCGRLFEGTPTQLANALQMIASLPQETLIYPAHEYTMANLAFCRTVNPSNKALQRFMQQCEKRLRDAGRTLPTTLHEELAINPFLRCNDPEIIENVRAFSQQPSLDQLGTLRFLRAWKDVFKAP